MNIKQLLGTDTWPSIAKEREVMTYQGVLTSETNPSTFANNENETSAEVSGSD